MRIDTFAEIRSTLGSSDHPYMSGPFTPNVMECNATDLVVHGAVPDSLNGVYLRNTQNPVHPPLRRHHAFDGDGMLHLMSFRDGKVEYRNRHIRTKGFMQEQAAGRRLYAGLIDNPALSEHSGWGARGGLRDTSATDVIVHAGMALTTFYQCGEPYRLDARTLAFKGVDAWGEHILADGGISAHPKVDPRTGELLFFNYSKQAPYMHYGVVDRHNQLVHYMPVPLPGPRLPHDMAFTEHYAILNDFPLYWDPELLKQNRHKVGYHPDQPSRFAIIPRRGSPEDIRWFEASPTYVLHWLNAWEEGDEIVLHGYHQESPVPQRPDGSAGFDNTGTTLGADRYLPRLHCWRFNLRTGQTTESRLSDDVLEFGMINARYLGRPYRYSYNMIAHPNSFLFDGITKYDHTTGQSQTYRFGEGRYGSESPFAPEGGALHEDDGYIVTFVTDMNRKASECLVLDARQLDAGPVARIELPHMISSGTHSCWADDTDITSDWQGID